MQKELLTTPPCILHDPGLCVEATCPFVEAFNATQVRGEGFMPRMKTSQQMNANAEHVDPGSGVVIRPPLDRSDREFNGCGYH